MYTPDFHRRGVLPTVGGKAVLRNNDVSTFSLDINGADPLSSRFERGWRIAIEDEGRQLIAGTPNRMGRSSKSGVHDLTLSGVDDMAWLKNMITLPNPSAAADNQSQDAYYKATATADTLIYDLARKHVGQNARTEYRRPLSVLQPAGTAKTLTTNSRFKTVLEEVQSLTLQANLVTRFEQDDDLQQTVMSIGPGEDLSRAIRLTERNSGLTDWEITEDAPTTTSVLVAGQGEGTARKLKLVTGNENDWGFTGLQFQDRRDTNETAELIQAGEETLEEGREKASISLEIKETPNKRFGTHFWLGDTITVKLTDGAEITDIVQAADITWDATGRTIKLTIGPILDEQDAPRWVPLVRTLSAQIRALQTR
ncbi:Gp37-like protein [Brevibacterium aurantiacum]|uniref:Gp37-like protein n=1 Tax=Brevibacterium aurantiacum TaxID=273384 RepID=UPI003F91AE81